MTLQFSQIVFIFDIDGTLIPPSSNFIDENTLDLLVSLSKKNKVILASARPYLGILNLIPKSLHKCFDYTALNGAFTILNNIKHYCKPIPIEIFKGILNSYNSLDLWTYTIDEWFSNNLNSNFYKREASAVSLKAKKIEDYNTINDIHKIIIVGNYVDLEKLKKYDHKLEIYNSNNCYIEINNFNVNKSTFLENEYFQNKLIVAFGDADNDIPLVKKSNFFFSMNRASENLKKISNFHLENNYYDGIVEALNILNFNK